jgi:D-alanyl-D-alanine carboxypeptidase
MAILFGVVALMGSLAGCGVTAYDMAYSPDSAVSSFNIISKPRAGVTAPFASNLCVVTTDIGSDSVDMTQASAAVLFDINARQVIYSKNAHERLYPASLTKVMTALVALKYGSPDLRLTATEAVTITERGAQLCGIKRGDSMTLEQALHVLLMYSANDAAMMIAENIGGSVGGFVEMMNEEAKRIGATNTNFVNPHGLSDEAHYSTAYDQYLIFNAAMKYDSFKGIIGMAGYQTTYYDSAGNPKELTFNNTNLFLKGDYPAPENITVMGGKTGTTNAAGHCLILLSKDAAGFNYISVILRSESKESLYGGMIDLLDEIRK